MAFCGIKLIFFLSVWVAEQARHPCPVLSLSMARGRSTEGVQGFDISLYNDLMVLGRKRGLPMLRKDTEGALGAFKDVRVFS